MFRVRLSVVLSTALLSIAALQVIMGDPAGDIVRVRLHITSTAPAVALSVDGAVLTNALAERVSTSGLRVAAEGGRIGLGGNLPGREVEAEFRATFARVGRRAPVQFTLEQPVGGRTILEVHNLNDPRRARLVDRFESENVVSTFTTHPSALRDRGPFRAGRVPSRLVLAFYYPWFERSTWANPQLRDRPAEPYSTESSDDVRRVFQQAKDAGLDGLVVSWQGRDFEGGWNHRRMLIALDAARAVGLQVAALLETTVANPEHDQVNHPADPVTALAWLHDILREYGSHQAYLRVDDHPVVFVYSVPRLRVLHWAAIVSALRAGEREPWLVGDATRSVWLPGFAGQFDYASNRFSSAEYAAFAEEQSLRVRSYHLLGADVGPRRIWAATVSPGYDDTGLTDGRTPRVTDRAGGAYYDAQWSAAIRSGADWVLVTSWNEWWENTHIEPSERYGTAYVERTKRWSARFKSVVVR